MRSVIFDLGGVVFDWNPDLILERFYDDPGQRSVMKVALFQHPDWLDMDRGVLLEPEAIQRVEARSGRTKQELADLFDAIRASLQPKPETVDLIGRLGKRGVPLYCLSNMPAKTFAFLRATHAFWPVFRGIVISGEVRMMKPDRDVFEYLLNRYGLSRSAAAFVDDHPPNIEAAEALGIRAILFRDAHQCEAELNRFLEAE